MTTTSRPVRRETFSSVRERGKTRPIIVELASTYVIIRLKGMRHKMTVTYAQLFNLGAKNAAEQSRKDRAEARRAKGKPWQE